jgi:hypothetical protein
MSKSKQAGLLSRFIGLAEDLRLERYRLAVVCGEISSGKSRVVKKACEQLQAQYVDLAVSLLPKTTLVDFHPTLGAFSSDDLVRWILSEANSPDVHLLVVDQIEPLLATFGRVQAVEFFRMVSRVEPKNPVILVTYLKAQVEEARFPKAKLLSL